MRFRRPPYFNDGALAATRIRLPNPPTGKKQITMENANRIVAEGIAAIEAATDSNALELVKARYLGKAGELNALLKTLGQMSPEERKTIGAHINECKNQFQAAYNVKRDALNAAKLQAQLAAEALDVTLPGRGQAEGGLHPVTLTLQRVVELFHGIGFEVADGPEIEDDFHNFQALNISENDAGLAKDNGKNYGVLNNSEPYVKLDEDAYIIMPKGAQFSDVSYKKTESAKGKKKVARLAYTYAGHEVGSVDIVKTGAKVKDNYYVNTDSGQKKNERVIRIDPAWLIVAGVVIVAAVVLLFLAKRAYDNFYVIRHQRKTKKNDKMRFREKKRKKYNRRKDRFF